MGQGGEILGSKSGVNDHPLAQLEPLRLSSADIANITHRAAEAFLGLKKDR